MDVYTYGGIDLLEQVFNGVAAIFKTKDFSENLFHLALAMALPLVFGKRFLPFPSAL